MTLVRSAADFARFAGGTIIALSVEPEIPVFRLLVEMPDEKTHVRITVRPTSKPALNGNVLILQQSIDINFESVEAPPV